MSDYQVRLIECPVGEHLYRLRVLNDTQQFSDPDGHGASAGISSAQWSLFGQVWPSETTLARAMDRFVVHGKRILELGCGIGLASIVLQRRGADVVASDWHPLAEVFLAYNAALNGLPALSYRSLDWQSVDSTMGRFELIIASDVLYEPGQAELLAGVIDRHAMPGCEVLLCDPGRGNVGRFARMLLARGFESTSALVPSVLAGVRPGRLVHFRREAHA